MDRYRAVDPLVVARAEGVFLFDVDGKRYFDANSSWWTMALGHSHPRLVDRLTEQAKVLAHCALAGITHEHASCLSEELLAVSPPGLSHVFYVDNGSGAVEVAMRMAVQGQRQSGREKKRRFVAIEGAFHGDTLGAAALGGVPIFRRPFADLLVDCVHVPFPDEQGQRATFHAVRELLERDGDEIAAVIVEPLLQGAAGMRTYPPSFLTELADVARATDVWLIVDEVFTGYGRTGTFFACEQAGVTPDVMCIGKAFAGGMLPMAAVLTKPHVEAAFLGAPSRALYYGHTFAGHPLGAALAREVLAIYRDEQLVARVGSHNTRIASAFQALSEVNGVLRTRTLGAVGAADLGRGEGYEGVLGWKVYEEARARGAYLRPLGDTVYVCPPLTISDGELDELLDVVRASVVAALG